MKSVVGIAQRIMGKMRESNEMSYNNKVWGNDINVGNQVLLRNFGKGRTGKLTSYWENTVYIVKNKNPDVPVYTICLKERNKI